MQLTQVDMQIEQSEETLLDLEKQAFEEKQTQAVNLRNATDQLQSQLTAWEQRYLLRSPVGGKVTFLNVWSVNQYVESGATVFVVAPEEESLPVGTALLPLQGSGKVKAGQLSGSGVRLCKGEGEKCIAPADGGRHVCGRYCLTGRTDNQLWEDLAVDS